MVIGLGPGSHFGAGNLFYEVTESQRFKAVPKTSFRYSPQGVELAAPSWLHFTLTLKLIDGDTNEPVEDLNVSIFTAQG